MNTRFYNARVLTVSGGVKVEDDRELWVSGNKIVYYGDGGSADKDKYKWDREINLEGNLLMPGFVNAHTHSGMTFLRSNADDLPLHRWLNEQVFPLEAKLTGEDIYWCTLLACLEYLTSGTTSICEMYINPYASARATEIFGMRCVQCSAINNFSQPVSEMEEWYDKLNSGNPLTSFRLGIHAEYTCSRELIESVAAISHKNKAPVYLHACETASEVEGCKERYNGLSPVQILNELGLFDYGATLFHGVHVNEKDMEIIKDKDLSVITNSSSNIKLASGIAPVKTYLEKGIRLGIGTDGPASNNCLDMFREMFLTSTLEKVKNNDASAVDALEVLKMATAEGAKAIGLDECGDIKTGMLADLIVIDMKAPNMQPVNNIAKNLVYSGSKSNVKLTMIDGEILYENGEFRLKKGCPEVAEIYEKVQAVIDRMR